MLFMLQFSITTLRFILVSMQCNTYHQLDGRCTSILTFNLVLLLTHITLQLFLYLQPLTLTGRPRFSQQCKLVQFIAIFNFKLQFNQVMSYNLHLLRIQPACNLVHVMLQAALALVQYALPRLSSDASIVFISSIMGYNPEPPLGLYGISKTALFGLTKALAMELGPKGIRVNCVAPGMARLQRCQFLSLQFYTTTSTVLDTSVSWILSSLQNLQCWLLFSVVIAIQMCLYDLDMQCSMLCRKKGFYVGVLLPCGEKSWFLEVEVLFVEKYHQLCLQIYMYFKYMFYFMSLEIE